MIVPKIEPLGICGKLIYAVISIRYAIYKNAAPSGAA
jgi:hypothetical protein